MSPNELAAHLQRLDWSAVSPQHQLAVSAAVETLRSACYTRSEKEQNNATPDIRQDSALAALGADTADTFRSVRNNPTVLTNAPPASPAASNVIQLAVRPRTCWTTLHHLDGRPWASSSHFGPEGAWHWIVGTVMEEHGVGEDDVHAVEDLDDLYDGDDLVTVEGLPLYRIRHTTI